MICAIPRAMAGSAGLLRAIAGSAEVPVRKSGSAIGIGWTLPWVTSSLSAAAAGCGASPARPAAAPAPSAIRRRRVSDVGEMQWRVIIVASSQEFRIKSAADHVPRIEGDLDVFPLLVVFGPEHVERLAAAHRAHRAVGRGDRPCALSRANNPRRCRERAVGLEPNLDPDDELLRIASADRRIPQLRQPRAQRVEL